MGSLKTDVMRSIATATNLQSCLIFQESPGLEIRTLVGSLGLPNFVTNREGVLNLSLKKKHLLNTHIDSSSSVSTISLVVLKNIVRQSTSDQENRNLYEHLTWSFIYSQVIDSENLKTQ